jgi:CHAT domain-containing protein
MGVLKKESAREISVRKFAPGREILHFACHGLVDQSYGNLFGALALTPGPAGAADAADDGYLTLAEIYALRLKGCELAILSACDTNYGPDQQGEGTWSLSRGFLVAGARRVVASNWLVDDEAAASLVSVFCGALVKAQQDHPLDYAEALHAAKRWVRSQEKWQSPYFWGSFVLVGPN